MSSARVVCRCCGRAAVWVSTWDADQDGGREGHTWMLADDAITAPWLRSGHVVHVVDPVRAA